MTNSGSLYFPSTQSTLFTVKDPISALTHFIGFCLAVLATPLMLISASSSSVSTGGQISLSIFMISMIFLYGASSAYHTFNLGERGTKVLKTIDHMMIFMFIAGTYTPVCAIILRGMNGAALLLAVWAIAILGVFFNACWINCPKWLSSVIYISMGWAAAFVIIPLYNIMSPAEFSLLIGGGILYTIGGVIYALKIKITEHCGGHEIFHIFVMLGSFCHYLMIYNFIQ